MVKFRIIIFSIALVILALGAYPARAALIGHWKFDETSGTSAVDASGSGITGTHVNTPTIQSDVPAPTSGNVRSLNFNGTNEYVRFGDFLDFNLADTRTFTAWIKPSTLPSAGQVKAIATKQDDNNGYLGWGFWLYDASGGNARLDFVYHNSGGYTSAYTNRIISTNSWTHVAVTYNNESIAFYVNGSLVANAFSETNANGNVNTSVQFCVACDDLATDELFAGNIDDVRAYNHILTEPEVDALMGVPLIANLSQSQIIQGNGSNVIITGQNFFTGQSLVAFNSPPYLQPQDYSIDSATQITVNTSFINSLGANTYAVTVTNSPPAGTSNSVNFEVLSGYPVPTITSINPTGAVVGSTNVAISVYGTGFFDNASFISWGQQALPTTFVSSAQLNTVIPSTPTIGTFYITVTNPDPGGGTSSAFPFTVDNIPPFTNAFSVSSNNCLIVPDKGAVYFSWAYNDVDADLEAQFQIQIDDNVSFSSPAVDRTISNISNASGSTNTQAVFITPTEDNSISYNKQYYWRVQVWQQAYGQQIPGLSSGWSAVQNYTTVPHPGPYVDFTWEQQSPAPDEVVQFINNSLCYSNTAPVNTFVDNPIKVVASPSGGFVYVAGSTNVQKLSTTDLTVVDSFDFGPGDNVAGMDINPNGGELYVTSKSKKEIKRISTATLDTLETVNIGPNSPGFVKVSPDGSTLIVLFPENDQAKKYSTANLGAPLATVATGDTPVGASFSPPTFSVPAGGQYFYVVNNASSTLQKILTATMVPDYSVPTNSGPNAVFASSDNYSIYTVNSDQTLQKFHALDGSFEIIWVLRQSAADISWQSVAYGNGFYAAVANSGTGNGVMTSPDGITWTPRTTPGSNVWNDIAYGNGIFAAVGSSGAIMTCGTLVSPCTAGGTWTLRTSGTGIPLTAVAFGGNKFVVVSELGYSAGTLNSSDGITWAGTGCPAGVYCNWTDITYGAGQFVAVTYEGTYRAMTSPDGSTWTLRTAPIYGWSSVGYGSGLFVAINLENAFSMTSPDGITWTLRTNSYGIGYNDIVYGGGLFVAVTNSVFDAGNNVLTSTDGISWTVRESAADLAWNGVAYGNGLFASVASTGTGSRVMTTEGIPSSSVATDVNPQSLVVSADSSNIWLVNRSSNTVQKFTNELIEATPKKSTDQGPLDIALSSPDGTFIYIINFVSDTIEKRYASDLSKVFIQQIESNQFACEAFEWNFGDGTGISSAQEPTHAWIAVGRYDVNLKVYDDTGFCELTKNINVSGKTQQPRWWEFPTYEFDEYHSGFPTGSNQCSDTFDNDGDGDIDLGGDVHCEAPDDVECGEVGELCSGQNSLCCSNVCGVDLMCD